MEDRPLCLLALGKLPPGVRSALLTVADGGGVRGLSELVTLEEIMNRMNSTSTSTGIFSPPISLTLLALHLREGKITRYLPLAELELKEELS
jgi:hypothetical protein